jgi:hypothetical protein
MNKTDRNSGGMLWRIAAERQAQRSARRPRARGKREARPAPPASTTRAPATDPAADPDLDHGKASCGEPAYAGTGQPRSSPLETPAFLRPSL